MAFGDLLGKESPTSEVKGIGRRVRGTGGPSSVGRQTTVLCLGRGGAGDVSQIGFLSKNNNFMDRAIDLACKGGNGIY